jgi:inhibitor of KinA sporulation pathway (predicted exonuclease)
MDFIIFDLEATCDENVILPDSEIIEIGAVRLNHDFEEVGRFNKFVRPEVRPILSNFCKRLTSIKQYNVKTANVFSVVMKEFEDWILESSDYKIYSWGGYDKNQILREVTRKT